MEQDSASPTVLTGTTPKKAVKRRYVIAGVAFLLTAILGYELGLTSYLERCVVALLLAALIFVVGWLYDRFWLGEEQRREIKTRWLALVVYVYAAILTRADLPWAIAFGGLVTIALGSAIDKERRLKNTRRLFESFDGREAYIQLNPGAARTFRSGEALSTIDGEVLIVDRVGRDFVHAVPRSESVDHS